MSSPSTLVHVRLLLLAYSRSVLLRTPVQESLVVGVEGQRLDKVVGGVHRDLGVTSLDLSPDRTPVVRTNVDRTPRVLPRESGLLSTEPRPPPETPRRVFPVTGPLPEVRGRVVVVGEVLDLRCHGEAVVTVPSERRPVGRQPCTGASSGNPSSIELRHCCPHPFPDDWNPRGRVGMETLLS